MTTANLPDQPSTQPSTQAAIGVTGLGTMGRNLARNLASRGHVVALHNRTTRRAWDVAAEHGDEGTFVPTGSFAELAASLQRPRKVVVMVPAGAATDEAIEQLTPYLEPGDVVIDAGNAHYLDTRRRSEQLRQLGLEFLGVGVSGGEQGALLGPSIMPGGDRATYADLQPFLDSIAARVDGQPCSTYIGPDGAGHFVKMVHNGIEYADMQLIAEAYDVLRVALGAGPHEIAEVFASWQGTELDCFLVDVTVQALSAVDDATGSPLVDVVADEAGMKGTGLWTVQAALALGVNVGAISEAVSARLLSGREHLRSLYAQHSSPLISPAAAPSDQHLDKDTVVQAARSALYAAKVVAYAQGFDLIRSASKEYDWDVDLAAVAGIWRGGCIIRAALLEDIRAAYGADHALATLLADPTLAGALSDRLEGWRTLVGIAVTAGLPVPVLSSTLAYYDSVRATRLPTSLIQAQRDIFGAHTYRRVDRAGVFHRDWSGSGEERVIQPA